MRKQTILFIVLTLITPLVLAACGSAAPKPAAGQGKAEQAVEKETVKEEAAEADLAAVKTYVVDNGRKMKAGTEAFKATAEQYYILIAKENFNYKTVHYRTLLIKSGERHKTRKGWVNHY